MKRIDEEEIALHTCYRSSNEVVSTTPDSKVRLTPNSTYQLIELGTKVNEVVWKSIDLERERIRAYERAYLHEKSLRIKAVDALRRHEERLFGQVRPVRPWYYGSRDNQYPEQRIEELENSMKGFIPTTHQKNHEDQDLQMMEP